MVQSGAGDAALEAGASGFVLHDLGGDHLAEAGAMAALDGGGGFEELGLGLLVLGAAHGEVGAGAQRLEAQGEGVGFEGGDARLLGGFAVEQPVGEGALLGGLGRAGKGALLGLEAAAELGEQGVVGVEDQRALAGVGAGVGIDAGGAGDHLLEPGAGSDVGEGGDDGDLGGVEALVGHGDGDEDRGVRGGGERRRGSRGPGGVGGGQRSDAGLGGGKPLGELGEVAAGVGLVGGDDEEFAQAFGLAGFSPPGAEVADRQERLAQEGVGEAGAERGEEGGAGGFLRVEGGEAVGADIAALLVAPTGLAVERAKGDGEDGALGQGLAAGVADHGPARGVEGDFAGAGAGTGAVGKPENGLAVGALEGAGEQEAVGGGFE